MNRTVLTAAIMLALCGPALAASITNKDGEARTLIITEGGSRSELSLAAGETVQICPNGCFLTLPNGDRAALNGGETIDISNGAAVFR